MLLRETFPVGAFQCNCTVLADEATREAVVIDPGGDVPRIRDIVNHHGLRVKAIVHTHAHLDHIYCTREIKEAFGGAICLHKDDLFLYDGIATQAAMFGWQAKPVLPIDRYIDEADAIEFGERQALVIHTPGHTPGSVCFEVKDGSDTIVFSGDTLFARGIGRTDLPGGHMPTILDSIANKLYTRPPESLVVPGHGPNTSIEEEAARNPFIQAKL